jgi:hypothetical protein
VADGRLHLSAVVALAPHLTPETADELLAAATHKSRAAIELLLVQRFPKPDMPPFVVSIAPAISAGGPVPEPVTAPDLLSAPGRIVPFASSKSPTEMEPLSSRAKLAPLSPGRFALQVTIDEETHEALRYAQALLGHSVASGDVAAVLKRAALALVRVLEKRKFAKCDRPQPQKGVANDRHIPAEVKRTVWERDGGQCTFVSDKGKRCEACTGLEFDHVEAVARGGNASVANIRLLCRAHNQHAADRALGSEFMNGKRQQGRERTARLRADAKAKAQASEHELAHAAAEAASQQEVIPWLRALGCRTDEARRAAARCAGMVDAPLEQRVRVAVQGLGPRGVRREAPMPSSPA